MAQFRLFNQNIQNRRWIEEKESYRQLKLAYLNNSDKFNALKFYRNEMYSYFRGTLFSKSENLWNKILLILDFGTSNFGQSYLMPLGWLFGFHLLFFSCFWNFHYWENTLTGFDEFGEFWTLLNPAHAQPSYVESGMGKFTDFVMRVSSGFFIFHFIKVTRRFGKD